LGEKKELVRQYMTQGLKREQALEICRISKNQFYYTPKSGKPGRRKSKTTKRLEGDKEVEYKNACVKQYIKDVFKDPMIDYGYHRMTSELNIAGFYINHKKVYRLMKEAMLLNRKPKKEAKNYVKYRVLAPKGPLRLLEIDIKQIWLKKTQRYGYILTIIDVFTRVVLYWDVGHHMKQDAVQKAWAKVIEDCFEPAGALAWDIHIEVRSDNGPQFSAKKLRKFLKENYLVQTFTHPYTPQENGHIESFHAILGQKADREVFDTLEDLEKWLIEFYSFYNYRRIHGSVCLLPPMSFWEQWHKGHVDRIVVDEKKRKVRFKLTIAKQQIEKTFPSGKASLREVSSLDFGGLDAPQNPKSKQLAETV
jgi:transposase InsO family protein